MTLQQIVPRPEVAPSPVMGRAGFILPVRLDGEPVTDLAYALPLPADFVPWEQVVEAYLATFAPEPQRAAA